MQPFKSESMKPFAKKRRKKENTNPKQDGVPAVPWCLIAVMQVTVFAYSLYSTFHEFWWDFGQHERAANPCSSSVQTDHLY